jgi:cytochrome c oxidase subunit 2
MLLALLVWILAVAVSWLFTAKTWWFPPPINAHGAAFDRQFALTLAVSGAIFVLAQGSLGFMIWRHRKRARAEHIEGNNRLEYLWTAATAALFLGLLFSGARIWAGVQLARPPAGAPRIEVSARQFAWAFRYPGPDGRFGRTDIRLVNDSAGNPFGIDDKDPAGRDDIVSASLRLPAGRPAVLLLTARDVIHNFFVPELRVKQDLVPGMVIPLVIEGDREGTYEVACSELCGLGHHQMRTTLQILSAEEFTRWMEEQTPGR